MNTGVIRPLAAKSSLHPARAVVRIERKFVQAPDEQGPNHQPLRPRKNLTQSPSESRAGGRGQAQSRVNKVVGAKSQGEGETACPPTNVKSQRYGEDYGAEEGRGRESSDEPHVQDVVAKLAQHELGFTGALGQQRGRTRAYDAQPARGEARESRRSGEGLRGRGTGQTRLSAVVECGRGVWGLLTCSCRGLSSRVRRRQAQKQAWGSNSQATGSRQLQQAVIECRATNSSGRGVQRGLGLAGRYRRAIDPAAWKSWMMSLCRVHKEPGSR